MVSLEEVFEKTWLPSDCQVTPPLSLGYGFCLPFPLSGTSPRAQTWDSDVVLKTSAGYTRLSPIKASINSEILEGRRSDPLVWLQHKTSILCKFPLLIKTVTHQPGVACLFPWSLPAPHVRGPEIDFTWKAPQRILNQWVCKYFLPACHLSFHPLCGVSHMANILNFVGV